MLDATNDAVWIALAPVESCVAEYRVVFRWEGRGRKLKVLCIADERRRKTVLTGLSDLRMRIITVEALSNENRIGALHTPYSR